MNDLVFAKLYSDAVPPVRKHSTDAGVDVFAYRGTTIPAHSCAIISTGLTFYIPDGYMLSVRPKSSSNHLIGAGVVDAGYQGELLVKVVNFSANPMEIKSHDPIAQVVVVPIETPPLAELSLSVIHYKESERVTTGGIVTQFNQ